MTDFEDAAASKHRTGTLVEVWRFLGQTKKWWLLPMVVILVLFGLLVWLSGTAAAPFIYSLF